ncbi:F-box protein CPR1-like [Argentina anserina]|uniref:F-box protein CPR1-like n=1 Tax=Argentina anserina TaxID=57926 RepID=UPI00217671F7|nr:F-box protein CPR1-like [Potentilla anserina]
MTEFCKYPEEMALQILSRMPPKTLMRFVCVRKSWCTLINSPSFVDKQLSNSLHNKQSTCIFCKRYVFRDIANKDVESIISLITFSYDEVGDNDHEHISYSIQDIDLPLSMSGVPKTYRNEPELLGAVYIVGHCDGIICLVHKEIVLWNPAIRQYKVLPKPLLDEGVINSLGFGSDAKSKDYKVFSFPTFGGDRSQDGEREYSFPPQVQQYSLSTDSWTEIDASRLETETTDVYPQFFQMYFNGIWYWIGCEQQKEFMCVYDTMDEEWVRQVIIVFDTNHQMFEDMLFPNSLYGPMVPCLEMRIIVWNESVALFGQYFYSDADDLFGLWVMDDIVKGSWTKQFTLQAIVGARMVLELWKSDEILMVANDNRIFSYNIRTEEIIYLPIKSTYPTFSATILCINSIVPVIHGRQQEV